MAWDLTGGIGAEGRENWSFDHPGLDLNSSAVFVDRKVRSSLLSGQSFPQTSRRTTGNKDSRIDAVAQGPTNKAGHAASVS